MKRTIAYGIVAVMALGLIAVLGMAQVSSVYNPIQKKNVPIERVTMDQIKAWIGSPSFTKWTNMDGLKEYLADKGVDMDELKEDSQNLDRRELMNLQGRNGIVREYTAALEGVKVVTDIDCDVGDAELEFEITNIGDKNWYLVGQTLTTGATGAASGKKQMSDAHVVAKEIDLYVNGFIANDQASKYWRGEKLFYPEGETFANACGADFLRVGKTVDCELKPIPLRTGMLHNSYVLIGPGFSETGTFTCN